MNPISQDFSHWHLNFKIWVCKNNSSARFHISLQQPSFHILYSNLKKKRQTFKWITKAGLLKWNIQSLQVKKRVLSLWTPFSHIFLSLFLLTQTKPLLMVCYLYLKEKKNEMFWCWVCSYNCITDYWQSRRKSPSSLFTPIHSSQPNNNIIEKFQFDQHMETPSLDNCKWSVTLTKIKNIIIA